MTNDGYQLNRSALKALACFLPWEEFDRVAGMVFDQPEFSAENADGRTTLRGTRWFTPSKRYRPGEWNLDSRVRPPRSGTYLIRAPRRSGGYQYDLSEWSPLSGWSPFKCGRLSAGSAFEYQEIE